MTFHRVLLIICSKIRPISAMFEEKPDFSTSDLHELHDRKLRNQLMIEKNRECQYYFWDICSLENYFVWVLEVFHKSRIPTKLNLFIHFALALPFRVYRAIYLSLIGHFLSEIRSQSDGPTFCHFDRPCLRP